MWLQKGQVWFGDWESIPSIRNNLAKVWRQKDRNLTTLEEFARWQRITAPARFGSDGYTLFVTSASYPFTRHVATECCFKITHPWAYYVEMKKWNGKSFSNVSGEWELCLFMPFGNALF